MARPGFLDALCGHDGTPDLPPQERAGAPAISDAPARIRPANTRPRCKACGGPWNGGPELLCETHAEQYADLWDGFRGERA